MNVRYCSICSTSFDIDEDGGTVGEIGIIPVAFCPNCRAGIHDFAQQEWNFVPVPEEPYLRTCVCELGGDCDKVTRCHMNQKIHEIFDEIFGD